MRYSQYTTLSSQNIHGLTCFYLQGTGIIPEDYTYAHHVSGIKQPFGQGGDCITSAPNCHKGNMTVNFTGTGFSLHNQVGFFFTILDY